MPGLAGHGQARWPPGSCLQLAARAQGSRGAGSLQLGSCRAGDGPPKPSSGVQQAEQKASISRLSGRQVSASGLEPTPAHGCCLSRPIGPQIGSGDVSD